MKITRRMVISDEIEVKAVRLVLPIYRGVEDMPADFPFRRALVECEPSADPERNEVWEAIIDLDAGRLRGWPSGHGDDSFEMRVENGGVYELLGAGDAVVCSRHGCYVLPGLYPVNAGGDGFNVRFEIDETGAIGDWSEGRAKMLAESFFAIR